ncbi:hypothetical protein [Rhodoblastus sp.]|uniref:hypothetical protein n=1 Tax=Rhodoblastus sp. TaxID=1962975 RepID=UPI003F97B8C8
MRQIGPRPLTGAEKQRRHRERVKTRLAEAERLKALLGVDDGEFCSGLAVCYDNVLANIGAAMEERDLLKAELPAIQGEMRAVLEARARNDLDRLRQGASRRVAPADRKKQATRSR